MQDGRMQRGGGEGRNDSFAKTCSKKLIMKSVSTLLVEMARQIVSVVGGTVGDLG